MKTNTLQATIMRRVYYAYTIRLLTHTVTMYGLALFALGWWLKELVFVARLWETFIRTPIGELGGWALKVVSGADPLTLLVFAVACVLAAGLVRQLQRLPVPTVRAV